MKHSSEDRPAVGPGTLSAHAALPPAATGTPFLPGPVFAGTFHQPGDVTPPYTYGRHGNPTWTGFEAAVSALEGAAETVAFASGMAAVSAVLLSRLLPGSTALLPADGYPGTRTVGELLRSRGVKVVHAPTDTGRILEALVGCDLVWLETPSNPGLDVCDIREITAAARNAGALGVVDNTLATPLGQRPLALGADVSVASGTKALTGHSDLLIGYVACADPDVAAGFREWRTITGGIPGPMETWLAHRSIATLALRTERQSRNALALASALHAHQGVTDVRHPGLSGDPSHATAVRQMAGYGCVVSFTLPDADTARRFLSRLHLVADATSFGGVHSTAERRGRWPGDDVAPGFIRFSAGCEDTADLVADVLRAVDDALADEPSPR